MAEDLIEQVTVGVDPSGGADEVGIVAALLNDGRFAVLADRSTSGSPAQWGEAVVRCHDDFDADDVVVEVNFGGDMATEVVKQAAAACGYALANAGHETRRIRDWLGHRLIAHTARYTQLSAAPFKDFWRL